MIHWTALFIIAILAALCIGAGIITKGPHRD